MKVDVITRHAIINYGSLLQAIATQAVIEQLGHSCEIIEYIREDETYKEIEKTSLKRKPNWNSNIIKRSIYLSTRQPESILSGKKFERERKKYLRVTRHYGSLYELEADPPKADVYVTGSDQVWGPVGVGVYDKAYCLSFLPTEAKKISYAASFGHTNFTPELKQYFSDLLRRYDYITVREMSAVEIVKNLKLAVQQVIDPTLLLGYDYWEQYIAPSCKEKYVLIYQLHNDRKLGDFAKKIAQERKLKLVRISTSLHQIIREGEFIWCPSISEFLSYIKYAELLITDSFHGTAFAINFNTPFVEVLPNNNTETRNDFKTVNQIILNEREHSREILNNMILY